MKTVVIYGPTAVGKSSIAVELAKKIDAEIISADSMQIYKGLDIGSAKVTQEEMQGIVHHLLDIKNPEEDYSVFEFCQDAKQKIAQINQKGKNVIIVGGTGLYLKALVEGYNHANSNKDKDYRSYLETKTTAELLTIYEQLSKGKELSVDKNNRVRLIRAIEIAKNNGIATKSDFDNENFVMFGIVDDRAKIYERINTRVDKMLKLGLIEEAQMLLNSNISENALSMKAIGYKEIFPYLKGEMSLTECAEILKQKTRNYAKRQFTFMNQFPYMTKVEFEGVENTALKLYKLLSEK